jgi:hypothetical protein
MWQVGAVALMASALMLGSQESAYGLAITGDGETRGSSLSSLYYQANNAAVSDVYGTAARPRPRGFIQEQMGSSGFGGGWIRDNVCPRRIGDDCAQRETSEGDGGSVGLSPLFPLYTDWLRMNFIVRPRIVDSPAFGNVYDTVENTSFRQENEEPGVKAISLPTVNRNVYPNTCASIQGSARQEFFDYVSGGDESPVGLDKKRGSMDTKLLRKIHASNRSDRAFHSGDSTDKFVIALSDGGHSETEKAEQKKDTDATSLTITLESVKPYSARCNTTMRNDIWDVQCPKDVGEVHIEAYPSGVIK